MLFLFILVHLFSSSGIAAPALHPTTARALADSQCDDINDCRKLFDIVWGCLTTIFACTWVSVHPNVPAPGEGSIAALGQRLKMMLIALLAPEIMVGFAARQFFAARSLSTEFELSMTHAFFFGMGGFVASDGYPVVIKAQLTEVPRGSLFLTGIKNVIRDDIEDKGNGDALSKGLALLQGLWFITQCLARVQQDLPLTELEVTTLAFVVAMVFIWLLWWHKPLDVQRQIVIGPSLSSGTQPTASRTKRSTFGEAMLLGIGSLIWGVSGDADPPSGNSVSAFWSTPKKSGMNFHVDVAIVALVGAVFGAVHCAAWNSNFPTRQEMLLWRACAVIIAAVPSAGLVTQASFGFSRDGLQEENCTIAVLKIVLGVLTAVTTGIVALAAVPCYLAARVILLTLPLIALRAPPAGAFMDINWTAYIPHL